MSLTFFCVDYSSVAFVLYESLGNQEGELFISDVGSSNRTRLWGSSGLDGVTMSLC